MSAPIWRFRIGSHTLTFTHPGRIAVILVAVVLLILLFWKTWHRDGPPPQTSADAEIPSRVAVNDVNQTVEDRTIDRLTAAETIGAVFYRTHDTSTWHLLCRAHPQAVDGVEIIVRADELAEYHANAWKVLGYLGDARHVRLMERKLQTEFAGLLDDHHKDELGAMFDFLGLSCRRGIPEAIALVDQMQLRRYWTSVKFHLYPEQIRQRRDEGAMHCRGGMTFPSVARQCCRIVN